MQAILIDAAARDIRAAEYQSLADLQRLIGGLIAVAWRFDNDDVLFVDDEGLLKPQDHFFRLEAHDQPLAGNGVLVGPDDHDEDGDEDGTDPPGATVAELAAMVRFMTGQDVQIWTRQHASRPATRIITLGPNGIEETVISTVGDIFGGQS